MYGGRICFILAQIVPMKALKTVFFFMALTCARLVGFAQSGTADISQRAIVFADSLNNAFTRGDWNGYLDLSYPGVVSYYGGKENFTEYITRARSYTSTTGQKTELLQIVQDNVEWQCVVKKRNETLIDGRKAEVVSYMVGQSKDNGQHWKYFDVAYNSVSSLGYIMPDIFNVLSIPQRQIIFEKDGLARQN